MAARRAEVRCVAVEPDLTLVSPFGPERTAVFLEQEGWAVSELADSSVNMVVRPWCKAEDYWALKFDLTRRFKEELEKAGCSIPYPQRDVHLIQQEPAA